MVAVESFQQNVPLAEYSTFGIGGPAKYFTQVTSVDQAQDVIRYAHEQNLPFIVIGKGSNCLFDDRGFDGLVILNKIQFLHSNQEEIEVGSGYSFALLGVKTARMGFEGLEFASGIPATVGGAVFMNAGANGTETKDCLVSVDFLDERGDLHTFHKEQLNFGYRHSVFHAMRSFIVSARFKLKKNPEAKAKQLQIVSYRTKTQPYGDKSAGCVFRNLELSSAGAIIERCGLKGLKVGGAEVSTLHANFIVNKQTASSLDVLQLIEVVKAQVKDQTGYDLHMEIRYIPYDWRS